MTLETCKAQVERYKLLGEQEKVDLWQARVDRKLKHPKYADLEPEEAVEEAVAEEPAEEEKPKKKGLFSRK